MCAYNDAIKFLFRSKLSSTEDILIMIDNLVGVSDQPTYRKYREIDKFCMKLMRKNQVEPFSTCQRLY